MHAGAIGDMERDSMARTSKTNRPALGGARDPHDELAALVDAAVQQQMAALRSELAGGATSRRQQREPRVPRAPREARQQNEPAQPRALEQPQEPLQRRAAQPQREPLQQRVPLQQREPLQQPVPQQQREPLSKPRAAATVERPVQKGSTAGKPLDMRCRVEGCVNRSGGPRNGYLCPLHRRTLTAEEQQNARARYNALHRGETPPAPVAPAEPPVPRTAVAPLRRAAQAATGADQAAREAEIARAWTAARRDTPLSVKPIRPPARVDEDDSIGNRARPADAPEITTTYLRREYTNPDLARRETAIAEAVRRESVNRDAEAARRDAGAADARRGSDHARRDPETPRHHASADAAPAEQAAAPVKAAEAPRAEERRSLSTPAGSDYALVIERTRLIESKKLGPTLEVRFEVAEGPHAGTVARGQFPLSGKGMPVLVQAALGVAYDPQDLTIVLKLEGKRVLADVISTGTDPGSLALVRNLRAPA